ncbi:MAG: class I SAM-dependent methyltransferase [Acidobacteriota bacterium]|nr:class I SAM-dependent methyltransferase [Acidobacteriota bacterium]
MNDPELLSRMQREWDARAVENARFYVNTAQRDWNEKEFFESGRRTVQEEVLTDMINICQGKDPRRMTVIEIGCGVGRVTRALAEVFGTVHGVDVSGEMVRRAADENRAIENAHFWQNNGTDLAVLGEMQVDFAFSSIVFQHIPSRAVIENYVSEVHRLLRPGGLFKFQVQGDATLATEAHDTWLGVPFSDEEAVQLAMRCGFEPRHRHGAGGQYFWLWFFKT